MKQDTQLESEKSKVWPRKEDAECIYKGDLGC